MARAAFRPGFGDLCFYPAKATGIIAKDRILPSAVLEARKVCSQFARWSARKAVDLPVAAPANGDKAAAAQVREVL